MEGNVRKDIRAGLKVAIVLKEDQRSGALTEGVVKDILTKSPNHPHGIKVRLESGLVGRVAKIYSNTP
ncbi:MAG: YwbE family protein [Sphaerochaeta sp.]|nr:YwbE family protein [Sphaerochaeta sp.]